MLANGIVFLSGNFRRTNAHAHHYTKIRAHILTFRWQWLLEAWLFYLLCRLKCLELELVSIRDFRSHYSYWWFSTCQVRYLVTCYSILLLLWKFCMTSHLCLCWFRCLFQLIWWVNLFHLRFIRLLTCSKWWRSDRFTWSCIICYTLFTCFKTFCGCLLIFRVSPCRLPIICLLRTIPLISWFYFVWLIIFQIKANLTLSFQVFLSIIRL